VPDDTLVMGAVAYDPKVVTIWEGFRHWFREREFEFDFVLYSNYERQTEDLMAGRIGAAWHSPLAWVRSRRLSDAGGIGVRPLVMRDTDQDLRSVIVVRSGSPVASVGDLRNRVVGTGAVDSPQATILPLDLLVSEGIAPDVDVTIRRFDIGTGLHGDHVGGERAAAEALMAGEVDAACMIDANHLAFSTEGLLPPGETRVIGVTERFDHCNMTVPVDGPPSVDRFGELLCSMDYGDAAVRPLLDLEGLTRWLPGRTDGYRALERAVNALAFYDADGAIIAPGYRP
jgi:ABC-type phosphate/phosphonate transport system substrate-binding protein